MIESFTLFGRDISLYYSFWLLGLLGALIIGWGLRKNYGFSLSRATILIVLDIILAYLMIWIMSWICGGGKINGFNFARIAAVAPLYFVLLAYLFKEPMWKISDFLAPPGAVILGISHLGCIFQGCCRGYPSQWGIYNNIAQEVCFPIQPIESAINLSIAAVLCWMAQKKKQRGCLYIWFMILFGITRFTCEFFRNNHKVWNNISELALHALASLFLGAIALLVIKYCGMGEFENENK